LATAEEILKTIKTLPEYEKVPLYKKALGSYELTKALGEEMGELKDVVFEEDSIDHKYQQAVFSCVNGNVDSAVGSLIQLVKENRDFDKARQMLFKVFNALGNTHPVTIKGRKDLAQALFM
jgi:putative thioredoxin